MIPDDTIAAISTPAGEGGIGIVRLSGKDAIKIADRLFHSPKGKALSDSASHRIIYGFIKDTSTNETVDEALVSKKSCIIIKHATAWGSHINSRRTADVS